MHFGIKVPYLPSSRCADYLRLMSAPSAFGPRLRWWRTHRGQSQLALAGTAEISQRHLSFLESGRTAPSRDMVMRLAAALEVPLRQQNALMLAAGYAPGLA